MIKQIFNELPGFIGWKDIHFHYLGCNNNLAYVMGLSSVDEIIGLTDHDLTQHNQQSNEFHLQNDALALKGITVKGIHKSSFPYDGSLFHFVKKPLYDANKNISGIIFTCQNFLPNTSFKHLMNFDAQTYAAPVHYQLGIHQNPYKLSERELECLFLLLRDKSAKEIGDIIKISKRTVESYIDNIKNKFGCYSKTELIYIAIANHYLSMIPPRFVENIT